MAVNDLEYKELRLDLVNNRLDMDYELGISNEAVEAFMALEEVQGLGE